jgi:hypothetical protein
MPFTPFTLTFDPGIQRDGTELSSNAYTDGVWARMQFGRPRKIGGYKVITALMTDISRALNSQTQDGSSYIHSGFAAGIEVVQIDSNGIATVPSDRTPVSFPSNVNNIWQLSTFFDTTSDKQQEIAFVVPGLRDIAYGATTGHLYAGPVYTTTALTSVSGLATDATGGIVVMPPYLTIYGSNGLVQWSAPGTPLDLTGTGSGAARVTEQKIVRGLPLRGGGGFSPAALLWSLDSVIRMYFVGEPAIFSFDTLTAQSSILSHNGVIENDGVFYWVGQDRFFMFNGVVREIPNDKNLNFFMDNVNRNFAQKVFATKCSRYGEIWWCFPFGNATEPNWAVIYNYRENSWYDTPLPNGGRSYGIENDIAAGMIMSGVQLFNHSTYRLWQHESGTDEIDVNSVNAVPSSFTTAIITPETFSQPRDGNLHIDTLEPDFVQAGDMTVTPIVRGVARSPFVNLPAVSFSATATNTLEQQVSMRVSARQMKLQFASNVTGGNYQCGKTIANIEADQARRTR